MGAGFGGRIKDKKVKIMGYADITLSGSDGAADMYYVVRENYTKAAEKSIKALRKELKDPGNSFNTTGPTNVALVLTEGAMKDIFLHPQSRDLVEDTIIAMEGQILETTCDDEWDDVENRNRHIKRWRQLVRKLRTQLKKLPDDDEDWDEIWDG